jgi:hypothetical protein
MPDVDQNGKSMDTRDSFCRAVRVRDVLLIAAVALAVSPSNLAPAAEPANAPVSTLLKRLVDPRFGVRSAAERDLTLLSSVDIPPLETAATRDAEHAARVVALLERLYVGNAVATTGVNFARAALLSSADPMLSIRRVGDFGETDVTRAAEQALDRLADGQSPAAPLAQAVLARHAVLAENRAIATLRSLGAKVVFSSDRDPLHDALKNLAEGAAEIRENPEDVVPPEPRSVAHVYVLRNWSGGRQGLEYLRRLRVDGGLQLYLVDGCGITLEDALPLKASIPGLTPIPRSAATLGVRWVGYQISDEGGCEIAGVQEGLAADRAGLRNNFVIKAVNGDPIRTFDDGTPQSLVQRLRTCAPGETITMTIVKVMNGAPEDVQVTLSDWSDVPDVQVLSYR